MLPHDLPKPPESAPHERRWRTVYLSSRRVFDVLTQNRLHVDCLNVPTPVGLPDGYRVVVAFHSAERNGFAFYIEHESFDPVPEGCLPPEIELQWYVVQVARRTEDCSSAFSVPAQNWPAVGVV